MFIKSSLARWACIVTIGLCANLAHASDQKKPGNDAHHTTKCSDKMYADYLYCLGNKAAYSVTNDDIGMKSFHCTGLSSSQVEECSKRNGQEVSGRLFNKNETKK